MSIETYNDWTTRGLPEPSDLIVTTEAPVGETALYPAEGTFLLTRRVIGFQTSVDNRYLQHCFHSASAVAHVRRHRRGTSDDLWIWS